VIHVVDYKKTILFHLLTNGGQMMKANILKCFRRNIRNNSKVKRALRSLEKQRLIVKGRKFYKINRKLITKEEMRRGPN